MLRHLVMWKLKDFAEGYPKEENALLLKHRLETLPDHITEIRKVEAGINILNHGSGNYDVVLEMHFDNEEDLQSYQNHPKHLELGDWIKNIRLERVAIDYNI